MLFTRSFILLVMFSAICFLGSSLVAGQKKSTWWVQAEKEATAEGYALLTVESVKALYETRKPILILDVRPDYEYRMGHLPQAVNLEFHLGDRTRLTAERKEKLLNILGQDKDQQIVIYCRSYS